jgi:hypothetical protein
MTIWWHPSGRILFLCFAVCQFCPEPFRDTGLPIEEWERIDPWRKKRRQPRLAESMKFVRRRKEAALRVPFYQES